MKNWLGMQLDEVSLYERALATVGGLLSIGVVWIVSNAALGKTAGLF